MLSAAAGLLGRGATSRRAAAASTAGGAALLLALLFGAATDATLGLLELTELAGMTATGAVTPLEQVLADLLAVSQGQLNRIASAARLAVEDHRYLGLQAQRLRR